MERQRKYKIFSIVALVVAIAGMSLGFAAFSKVLTITATATVTPNEEDFKLVTYGFKDQESLNYFLEVYEFSDDLISDKVGVGYIADGEEDAVSTPASITNNLKNTTISNINVEFKDFAIYKYYFIIKNEGQYDAYIDLSDFLNYLNKIQEGGECIGENNQEEINKACENVGLDVYFEDRDFNAIMASEDEPYYKLSIGDYVYLTINVFANGDAIISEPYSLNFDDLTINFSTAPPSNN